MIEPEAHVTTDYDNLSDSYGQTKVSPLRKYVDEYTLFKVLGNIRGKSVLDLACGDGHYTRLVKAKGAATVVGVDISPAMIDAARHAFLDHGVQEERLFYDSFDFAADTQQALQDG